MPIGLVVVEQKIYITEYATEKEAEQWLKEYGGEGEIIADFACFPSSEMEIEKDGSLIAIFEAISALAKVGDCESFFCDGIEMLLQEAYEMGQRSQTKHA